MTQDIAMSEDPEELLKIYEPDTLLLAAKRLLDLKRFTHFAALVKTVQPGLIENDTLMQLIELISHFSRSICEAGISEDIVRYLLDLARGNTLEALKVCVAISEIVTHNKQFPSKAIAILYFQTLTKLFEAGGRVLPYLNAAHLLNELEEFIMGTRRFEFLKRLASIQPGEQYKDLFCGMKMKNIDSIILTLEEDSYEPDPILQTAVQMGTLAQITPETVSLLLKNAISFKIESGEIKIQKQSFTQIIFDIVARYQPVSDNTEYKIQKKEIKAKVETVKQPVQEPIKPKVTFKNRFTVPYKKSRLLKRFMRLSFEDTHFEERNRNRNERLVKQQEERERTRKVLMQHEATVYRLRNELKSLLEEKAKKEKEEMLEKARLEEERILKERMEKMWRRQPDERNKSASDVAEGVYVPRLTTMNFTECDLPNITENKSIESIKPVSDGIYTPKYTTLSFTGMNILSKNEESNESSKGWRKNK